MRRLRIGVLASGGGTNLQAIIDACERGDIDGDVVVVISNVPEAFALQYDIEGGKFLWVEYNEAKEIYELHIR